MIAFVSVQQTHCRGERGRIVARDGREDYESINTLSFRR